MTPIDVQATWSRSNYGLCTNAVCSISFDPLPNSVLEVDALREWMFPIDVQVTWSKVKVKLLVFIPLVLST